MDRPLTISDVTIYRRSLAMSTRLTPGQTGRVLDELERLLLERQQLEHALAELARSWPEVRRLLGELQRTVDTGDRPV